MREEEKDLIRYRMERAKETLCEARLMYDENYLYGAANRIYYACFYAVLALLLTKKLSSSKHSGVIKLFNQHFVKEGIIPIEMGKFYSRMFDTRMESDYSELVQLEKSQIESDIAEAEKFIATIDKYIAQFMQ